ncbi:MAG: tetrathionate reductase family octaheme c-type cytochrome [Deltaproteobacteria bacterium]|nr:tetrathionate reductase family octaheme c-type cytochrome [Deltaproteobacteria bacterium]
MKTLKPVRGVVLGIASAALVAVVVWWSVGTKADDARPTLPAPRPHLDHSAFFNQPFKNGVDVTKACLKCHQDEAKELHDTPHWQWLGDEEKIPGRDGKVRIGKKNVINNFCISIKGNWSSCTKCHAGYGWKDQDFDFDDTSHMDCLVCHDHSGGYAKDKAGWPRKDSDLLAAAKSVGYPTRTACGSCHNYGGGGLAVKHGDLDSTLDNPDPEDDVHMGKYGFTCVDCHGGKGHTIKGKTISVSTNDENGIGCADCHGAAPHESERLNQHADKVACQTCHIPTFANSIPTKMWWDWSKAGDDTRKDDIHHYLKIKGEFRYASHVTPEYYWFDGTAERYLLGDRIPDEGPVRINHPVGDRDIPGARIWPFKVHRGKQIFDTVNRTLLAPLTSGKGGFWHDFDWDKALRLAVKYTGLPYSGHYGFVKTEMYWPINHMVQPKNKALRCVDCHGPQGRLDWKALGYPGDPMNEGVRP